MSPSRHKLRAVWGLHGEFFVAGGAADVASVRRCQKLPLCPIQPMLAGSKTDSPLAKAEPISHSGSTSMITY